MSTIPFLPYKLFFLYIEPISAIAGAYYAAIQPQDYLQDLAPTAPTPHMTTAMGMTLMQLANLYALFALHEHLVLSSTSSLKVWRRILFCLLVADFGHLATMAPLGSGIFWRFWEWNAMAWGSVGFVYVGASMRLSFLAGLGLGEKGTLGGNGIRNRR
ncbi:hypothetical protein FIBSPDRAFT_880457 [Athelia psychrophila]|uniref:DUF7704 domain-containing protein n=1 Tax=Athelia psychrophila TaxID=1759441 RepID=A0A167SUS9_9AGAM|nr:hypothetical protein FIBSPDRAFT_880457 [Fibularhizoctonia sp. CBS 109695]